VRQVTTEEQLVTSMPHVPPEPMHGHGAQALPRAVEGAPAAAAGPPAVPVINYDSVPSLRGTVVRDLSLGGVGTNIRIKGVWAMTDSQHGQEGLTSDFELVQLEPFTPANILILQGADQGELKETALSGKYKGWFRLKRASGSGSDQIAEKDVILSFNRNAEGGFDVSGEGSNKFGSYVLKGGVNPQQQIIMYRQYVVKVGGPPPAPSPRNKKKAKGSAKGGAAKSAAAAAVKATRDVKAKLEPQGTTNQREGAGRDRKQTSVMSEAYAVGSAGAGAGAAGAPKKEAPQGQIKELGVAPVDPGPQRAQRLSQHLVRCGELLKEMTKIPSSFFFLEPVDYLQLNIPEYPNIIATPMDFRTIREKLFESLYGTHMDFAADVRLVFRNAITFNQMRDNPVHMAAREMSAKFEERFRILSAQAAGSTTSSSSELAAYQARLARAPPKPKPKTTKQPVMHSMPPDGSMVAMQQMQQRMMDMQSEISRLRTTVNHDAVVDHLNTQQAEAQNPLTYAEKKALIGDINKLAPEHMDGVIEIVSAATADNGEDEDIEVPLDELDTATLRTLQRYVADIKEKAAPKKAAIKKQAPAPAPHASYASYAPPTQQQQQQGFGVAAPAPAYSEAIPATVEMESDLFFAPEAEADVSGPSCAGATNAAAWQTSAQNVQSAELAAAATAGHFTGGVLAGGAGAGADESWGTASNELASRQQGEEQRRRDAAAAEAQRQAALTTSMSQIEQDSLRKAQAAEMLAQADAAAMQLKREQGHAARESMQATTQGDSSELAMQIAAGSPAFV